MPSEKCDQSFMSPWSLHYVLTGPVTKHFSLWHTTQFGVPKPSRLLQHAQTPLLLGEEGGSPQLCCFLGPFSKSSGQTVLWITVSGDLQLRSHSWAHSFQPASLLRYLGALLPSSTPGLPGTPKEPETTLSHRGFHTLPSHQSDIAR